MSNEWHAEDVQRLEEEAATISALKKWHASRVKADPGAISGRAAPCPGDAEVERELARALKEAGVSETDLCQCGHALIFHKACDANFYQGGNTTRCSCHEFVPQTNTSTKPSKIEETRQGDAPKDYPYRLQSLLKSFQEVKEIYNKLKQQDKRILREQFDRLFWALGVDT